MTEEGMSFPCIICGKALSRVHTYEAQPEDGVMCTTYGNYGSTVFDPMANGVHLSFNICDDCLVAAGKKGAVKRSVIKPRPEPLHLDWPIKGEEL